jgi:thiamine pyrophosphate-dependent acetolactate synthase large subunit-like protein
MLVAEAVGRTLADLGVDHVFGVVGSGNFHVTNALVASGARFVAARHEGGAATMADAFSRVSGRVAAVSVHQGCGLTNALTGITEAAKSRTPLLVLTAEATQPRSNFYVDQSALAAAVGAVSERIGSPETAVADATRAYRCAVSERRTVVLNLPLEIQAARHSGAATLTPPVVDVLTPHPEPQAVVALADALAAARRPVFVAGRGARLAGARGALEQLAQACGALLATSAVAKGLFAGNPFSLDVSGGFASPLAAELIRGADLIVGWGCALNMWTMRHGRLIAPGATVVQVDLDADALGAHRPVDLGVLGDVRATAEAVTAELVSRGHRAGGYRGDELRDRIAREHRWRDVPYMDTSDDRQIDPRTLTIGLDDLLPTERVVAIDSGNFMGYPSMFLSVPDEAAFCFTQAYQSIGLGLSTAIGAALARPDRLPVAACGDGGFLMGVADLETAVRLGLPLVVVVYNDAAYGAEVHHFGPDGHPLDIVRFPDVDIAAIGRGFGCDAVTVRTIGDLKAVGDWVAGTRDRPLVVDAKIVAVRGAWWLEEAFRGH